MNDRRTECEATQRNPKSPKFHLSESIEGDPHLYKPWIDNTMENALQVARGYGEVIPHGAVSRRHFLLRAGRDRGGSMMRGGVTWCDWDSLHTPSGIRQICGHTVGSAILTKYQEDGCVAAVCIDTDLKHYAILTDGVLEIKKR